METKWTPGPWYCVEQNKTIVRSSSAKEEVARASHCYMNRGEREANAHLISAAPELYEALEVAEEALSDIADDEGWLAPIRSQINAALSKARGES